MKIKMNVGIVGPPDPQLPSSPQANEIHQERSRDKAKQHESALSDSEDEGTGGRKHRQNHGDYRNGSASTSTSVSVSGRKSKSTIKIGATDKLPDSIGTPIANTSAPIVTGTLPSSSTPTTSVNGTGSGLGAVGISQSAVGETDAMDVDPTEVGDEIVVSRN